MLPTRVWSSAGSESSPEVSRCPLIAQFAHLDFFPPGDSVVLPIANCAPARQQLYPGQREGTRATNRICSVAARKRE